MKTRVLLVLAVAAACLMGLATCQGGDGDSPDVDLTGYWAAYQLSPDGEEWGPVLTLLLQTGSTVDGYGFTGTVDGSVLTIRSCGEEDFPMDIESPDRLSGEGVWLERVKDLSFGPCHLSGFHELNSEYGLGRERDSGEIDVEHLDHNGGADLILSPLGPIIAGTFSVPGEMGVDLHAEWEEGDCGPEFGFEGDAISGDLVITSYEAGVGIAGYFTDMVFPGGTLSGSFDVRFELNRFWAEFP